MHLGVCTGLILALTRVFILAPRILSLPGMLTIANGGGTIFETIAHLKQDGKRPRIQVEVQLLCADQLLVVVPLMSRLVVLSLLRHALEHAWL